MAEPSPHQIDPLSLAFQSRGVVLGVLLILVVASFAVWVIWFLKALQLARMRSAQRDFEEAAASATSARELEVIADQ
ncbi:MAG: hypothetical protein RJA70_2401, partial [Pseudomonadota bacterium]